ncbi:T9SS type A sorting domain-containing protein [bacterium]|nr:T9SS type A sorting domain-containing protein [bacterium]
MDLRIPTPCRQFSCAISSIDTIKVEKTRGYGEPRTFDVHYTLSNLSDAKGARVLQATIDVPPGLEVVAPSSAQPMLPAEIGPGESASCTWTLRVKDASLIGDTLEVLCKAFFVDPESGAEWPAAEEWCTYDIVVKRFDEDDPRLSCLIEGPDRVYWKGNGYAETPDGEVGLLHYMVTYTNVTSAPVPVASFQQSAIPNCRIFRNPFWPGETIAPGASVSFPVEVRIDALRFDRDIIVRTSAMDEYGLPWSDCEIHTNIPGVPELPCEVEGPEKIVWNTALSTADPAAPQYTLTLNNPLDTVRVDVRVRLDLISAPHLGPAAGDSLVRDSFNVEAKSDQSLQFNMVLQNPPAVPTDDTLLFAITVDGFTYYCSRIVHIDVIDKTVVCTLNAPDQIDESTVLSRALVPLQYNLTNSGTVQVEVDRIELEIAPGSGVMTEDALIRSGGTLTPGNSIPLDWNLRILALRSARTAHFSVTAYGRDDEVIAACTKEIEIEAVESPKCRLNAVDTVRFDRDHVRYEPYPVPLTVMLDNLLDEEETNVVAEIALDLAPRFELNATEVAQKNMPVLDTHSTSVLGWLLIPQRASIAEDQEIIVRYRSDEQTEWKQCSMIIHIEAWPEETGIACSTGGHDSLYADPYYERFIPDPLFVSYTVTNTGTIALTGCEASIVLPKEFVLAGSDSTQLFTSPEFANQQGGPVSPGTLLPNATCTRWWMITPSNQLTAAGPVDITWQWRSDQQGSGDGCSSSIEVVFDSPAGIVLSPKHLYFEAERGGPLPAAQNVQLWTGGGLTMPWSMQPTETWLNANPLSGSQEATVAVQPNSTMLDVGGHAAALNVSAAPSNRSIAVTYVIRKSTSVGDPSMPAALTLEAWPQPVTIGGMLQVAIAGAGDESYRLSLYDMLGRERLSRTLEAGEQWSINVSATQFTPGSYILRVTAVDGTQVSRLLSVIR